jgi:hypothetical protein
VLGASERPRPTGAKAEVICSPINVPMQAERRKNRMVVFIVNLESAD